MANLSDLYREIAYLQGGGKPEGQRTIDKLNQTFSGINNLSGTITNVVNNALAQKQAALKARETEQDIPYKAAQTAKLQQEIAQNQIENQPYRFRAPGGQSPEQTQALTNEAMNSPIPVEDLISGNLSTADQRLEAIKRKIQENQAEYGDLTQKEHATDVLNQLRNAQAEKDKREPQVKNPELITASEFAARRKAGEKLNSTDYRVVPDSSSNSATFGLREQQQQDNLEQHARQSVGQLRGDKSLSRVEEQRDAAIVAYNRIKEIQSTGRELNPIDYTDILGQIYKARTGAAPTERVLEEIRQDTAQGKFAKAYTYVTGQQAPATTQDITNSLKDMANSMGQQADKFHDAYMKAHLIKPKGLEQDRWNAIANTNRGLSFKEAIKDETGQKSDQFGFTIGQIRQAPNGNNYEYIGNNQWKKR